jgi:hypothetical protein
MLVRPLKQNICSPANNNNNNNNSILIYFRANSTAQGPITESTKEINNTYKVENKTIYKI